MVLSPVERQGIHTRLPAKSALSLSTISVSWICIAGGRICWGKTSLAIAGVCCCQNVLSMARQSLSSCSLKRLILLYTQLDCICVCRYVCIHIKQPHVSTTCGRLEAVSSLQDSSSILCQHTFEFLETNFPIFTQIHTNPHVFRNM